MNPKERADQLEEVALEMGKAIGYRAVTRHIIAAEAKVSPALVPHYLGDVHTMRKNILKSGCEQGHVGLILEGFIENDIAAKNAVKKFKNKIIAYLFGGK